MMIMSNYNSQLPFTSRFNLYPVIRTKKHRAQERENYHEAMGLNKREQSTNYIPNTVKTSAQLMSEEEIERCMNIYVNANIKLNDNSLTITNKNGKSISVEIPEEYFENVEDKERQVKNWLLDSMKNCALDDVPLEILDAEEKLLLSNVRNGEIVSYAEQYRQALDNGIKVGKIEKDPMYDFYNVDLKVDGRKYRYKSYEPSKYLVLRSITCSPDGYDKGIYNKSIAKMVDNIRNTQFGSFVKYRNHEYYVPNVFEKVPDIRNDVVAIEHGNEKTKETPFTIILCEKLSEISGQDVNMDNLKTINYLYKTKRGYNNNVLQTAYAFHDSENDMHYMYIKERGVLKTMAPNGYVMTDKLF